MEKKSGILISVVGISPQVVTETLYALVKQKNETIDEIFLITTSKGKDTIINSKFAQKIQEFNTIYKTNVSFSEDNIFVILNRNGEELYDIRDAEESEFTADFIYEKMKFLKSKYWHKKFHCSIAGGRKTMSAYMALMLNILGDREDKLYHVLVPSEVERDKNFFFPIPGGRIICSDGSEKLHEVIVIDLVDISYVRLKNKFGYVFRPGKSYNKIVEEFQSEVDRSKKPLNIYSQEDKVILIKSEDDIQRELSATDEYSGRISFIAGRSKSFLKTLNDIKVYADNNVRTLLIYGETGTGKDLLSRYFANLLNKGMLAIGFGSISKEIIASELFGHKKGAFTGAEKDREGIIEKAIKENLVLFFDEVEKCPHEIFAALNRFVQLGEIRKVGSDEPIYFKEEINMVFAMNERPEKLIEENRLPEDFYNRISAHRVNIDGLNERVEDIELIVNLILHRHNINNKERKLQIQKDAINVLSEFNWQNKNVRVLKNVIDDAIIKCHSGMVDRELICQLAAGQGLKRREDILPSITTSENQDEELMALERIGYDRFFEEKEKQLLKKLLHKYKTQKAVANAVNLKESTLSQKIKKYKISKE
ncbi:MAG: CRISPR-associated ring nuclease Csm6 [Deltaproteobacteria bacterium]|nr:CRISPR-associated ring nuclease Csm6 [Deltaproteobacteria bacterium]